jgi:hypothetical protein
MTGMAGTRDAKGSGFRSLKWLLCALLGLELAYVVAANGVLASGAVQRFVNATESAHLEFDEAYTLLPGLVHVEGLQLSYEDHNMQFAFDFEQGDLILHIPWLLKQRFSASRVRVEGLRFLFRHKVVQVAGHEAALARYPEIPHVATPPLLEQPRPSNRDDLWSFELRDVDAQSRELWFMTYRYLGPARATGGFQLIPYENLEVGPAQLTLESGTLHNGERRLLSADVRGLIDLYLAPVNPETLTGMKAFEPISASVRLDLRTENLDPVNLYVSDPRATHVSGGGGALHVDARLKHAKLTGGRIRYEMREPLRVDHPPISVKTAATVELSVARARTDLSLSAPHVVLDLLVSKSTETVNLAVAEGTQGLLTFQQLDLTRDLAPLETRWDVPVVSVEHTERMEKLIPGKRSWKIVGGSANGGGTFQSHQGLTQIQVSGDFAGLHLKSEAHELRGYGTYSMSYGASDPEQTSQLDHAEILFNTLTTRAGNQRTENWWASLSTSRLQLTGPKGQQVDGLIVARAKNPEPVRQALSIPGIAKLIIPDEPLEAVVKLEPHDDIQRLQLVHAKTGSLTVAGELWRSETCSSGAFRVAGIPVPVGVAVNGDDSEVTWFASENWLPEQIQDLGCRPAVRGLAQRTP